MSHENLHLIVVSCGVNLSGIAESRECKLIVDIETLNLEVKTSTEASNRAGKIRKNTWATWL